MTSGTSPRKTSSPVASTQGGHAVAVPGARSASTSSPPLTALATAAGASIPSAAILQGKDAITIEHNGRLYTLRKTRQGKLILTK